MKVMGQRIIELRNARGLFQKQLAEKVGVAQSVIARYEKALAKPGIDMLMQLAIALDTSTDYLLGLVDFE